MSRPPDTNQAPESVSMLRSYTIADIITLANAACGIGSVFICLEYAAEGAQKEILWPAFGLLILALIFDLLDGAVARKTGSSDLGADLDSLSDVISFGVAPAVLGYTLGLRGGWDVGVLIVFVVCGISRLARFNVTADKLADESTGKVAYFEGTPIPFNLVIVGILAVLFGSDHTGAQTFIGGQVRLAIANFHPFSIVYAVAGMSMISRIKIPKP